jgi:UDP:flavonoid glycosyltransferase YjiC (YdhE family)
MICQAIAEVLATPAFGAAARALAANFAGVDGAANAADEIEQLLAASVERVPAPVA